MTNHAEVKRKRIELLKRLLEVEKDEEKALYKFCFTTYCSIRTAKEYYNMLKAVQDDDNENTTSNI